MDEYSDYHPAWDPATAGKDDLWPSQDDCFDYSPVPPQAPAPGSDVFTGSKPVDAGNSSSTHARMTISLDSDSSPEHVMKSSSPEDSPTRYRGQQKTQSSSTMQLVNEPRVAAHPHASAGWPGNLVLSSSASGGDPFHYDRARFNSLTTTRSSVDSGILTPFTDARPSLGAIFEQPPAEELSSESYACSPASMSELASLQQWLAQSSPAASTSLAGIAGEPSPRPFYSVANQRFVTSPGGTWAWQPTSLFGASGSALQAATPSWPLSLPNTPSVELARVVPLPPSAPETPWIDHQSAYVQRYEPGQPAAHPFGWQSGDSSFFSPSQHNTPFYQNQDVNLVPNPFDVQLRLEELEQAPAVQVDDDLETMLGYPNDADVDRLQPVLSAYMAAVDKTAYGERALLILTPRFAIQEFGSPYLCLAPPPSAMLLGSSWWQYFKTLSPPGHRGMPPRYVLQPRVQFEIGGHTLPLQETHLISLSNTGSELTVMRAHRNASVGGQYAVLLRPRETDCCIAARATLTSSISVPVGDCIETSIQVRMTLPDGSAGSLTGESGPSRIHIRPQTDVSAPEPDLEFCVKHGDTIVLSHTQEHLTQFLCATNANSSFPSYDWQRMTGATTKFPWTPDRVEDFTAHSDRFDAFIIYLVDVSRTFSGLISEQLYGRPDIPNISLPFDTQSARSLRYNQTVILQCLSTGTISPVLILRQVDDINRVLGNSGPPVAGGNIQEAGGLIASMSQVALEFYKALDELPYVHRHHQPPGAASPTIFTYLGCEGENSAGFVTADTPREIVGSPPPTPRTELLRIFEQAQTQTLSADFKRKTTDWSHQVGSTAVWTINPVNMQRRTFCLPDPDSSGLVYAPIRYWPEVTTAGPPMISSELLALHGLPNPLPHGWLQVEGTMFLPCHRLWIGQIPVHRCVLVGTQVMLCLLPSDAHFFETTPLNYSTSGRKVLQPLLIVRSDGVIFRQRESLMFEIGPPSPPRPAIEHYRHQGFYAPRPLTESRANDIPVTMP